MTPQQGQSIQTCPVHTYDHISHQLNSLADTEQQQTLYTNEVDTSLFTTDTATPCAFNIITSDLETAFPNDVQTLYTNEVDTSLFTTDTATPCAFNIITSDLETAFPNDVHDHSHNNTGIHFYSEHK